MPMNDNVRPMAAPAIMHFQHELCDEVASVIIGHDNAEDYHRRKIRRSIDNWRMYWAHDPELGLGQWPEDAVNFMLEQGRQLIQYNFIKVIIDTIAGGIMQLPFDPEFYPVNAKITSLTQAIKQAMYSDKELMNWKTTYLELVRDGLVHEGVIKMYVDRKWDKLGNIGFKHCLPGSVLADPYWKSWASTDCKKCWHDTWHTAESLCEIYPDKTDDIMATIGKRKNDADRYGDNTGITPYVNSDHSWGDVYRLVQEYRMVNCVETREFAVTVDGEIEIPSSLSDVDKPQWLNAFHPTWDPGLVYSKPEKQSRCVVRAVCQAVSNRDALEVGKTEIQVGRLPYFFWSADRSNGESHSIVDSVKDAQQQINYMASLLTYKIQIEGGGGAQFADRSAFASNDEYERYKQNRNDPSETFETRPGLLEEGRTPATPVKKSGFPQEAYESINHIIKVILPHISKVTSATRGMSENAGESGKLFELMKIQSDQQVYTIHYGLRIFWNEVYEAYFMQAANTYSNEQIEREFAINGGKDSVVLNQRIRFPDGTLAIKNDVSMLKSLRHKVIIGEKQETPTEKAESLNAIGKFIKSIGQASPLVMKYLVNKAAALMNDILNEEDKETIKALGERDLALSVAQADAQLMTLEIQKGQLKKQIEEIEKVEQQAAQQQPNFDLPMPGQPRPPQNSQYSGMDEDGLVEQPPQINTYNPQPQGAQNE